MLLMVFQTAQNVALSQVHGACVSHPIFFYCFARFGIYEGIEKNACETQAPCTCDKATFCAVWNTISSMHTDVFTIEF